MNTYVDYLGIDISKQTFDVVNQKGKHFQYENTKKGFTKFGRSIDSNSLCVMEVTGIYHLPLAKFLHSKGIPVSVVNPLKIKRFSQMNLSRNKTDKADAKIISLFAQQQEVKAWNPTPAAIERGKDIIQITEQYIEFRAGLKNKIDALKSKNAPQSLIDGVILQVNNISKAIEDLQVELEGIVEDFDSVLFQNITSTVGIGKRTAALLIVETEGFKEFENAKQVCSFFGLAPTESSSGTSVRGSRKISKMGNPLVRKKLYMCSLQASRFNKACTDLYQRLLAKGKPKKLALIAVANKLLKIIFAISKSGLPYDREYKSYIKAS